MPENNFDERIAATYEAKWPELFTAAAIDPVVEFLAGSAGPGPVLELGVGTGRIAIPLSRRGPRVHGIEISPAMAARLQERPGGTDIDVTVGDFAVARAGGGFTLAYLVRNTITNLTSQDEQVACFRNVAAQLAPGGRFVIEVYVPELRRLPPGQTIRPVAVTPRHLVFEEYDDLVAQIAWSHHCWIENGAVETYATPHRYVWPSELDLMARIAGMTLEERWADWSRAAFTGDSPSHVSVWRKPSP